MRAKNNKNRIHKKNNRKHELTGYDYIYNLLFNVRNIDAYKTVIRDYEYLTNPIGNNNKSLFENTLNEYLDLEDEFDKKYYLLVLALILEKDPNSKLNEEVIIEFLNNEELNSRDYKMLVMLFKHYVWDNSLISSTSLDTLPSASSNYEEEILKSSYIGIPNLEDWSKKNSFTIDSSNIAYTIEVVKKRKTADGKEEIETIEINEEEELKNLKNKTEREEIEIKVYIHVPDLSEYLDDDSDAYEYAERKMFGLLFDEDFIDKYVAFKKNKKRFALTGVFTFDIYGKMKDFDLYKSVIEVNKEYSSKNPEQTEKVINNLKSFFPGIGSNVNKSMSDILNMETARLLEKRKGIPIIYKNIYDVNNMERTLLNSDTYDLTREEWKKNLKECKNILKKCFKDNDHDCVSYGNKQDGRMTKAEIADSIHRFPALMNQKSIKKYYIDKEDDLTARNKDRNLISVITIIANAVNKKAGTKVENLDYSLQPIKR